MSSRIDRAELALARRPREEVGVAVKAAHLAVRDNQSLLSCLEEMRAAFGRLDEKIAGLKQLARSERQVRAERWCRLFPLEGKAQILSGRCREQSYEIRRGREHTTRLQRSIAAARQESQRFRPARPGSEEKLNGLRRIEIADAGALLHAKLRAVDARLEHMDAQEASVLSALEGVQQL